jgi:outer membrane biosynthesis protein TonB
MPDENDTQDMNETSTPIAAEDAPKAKKTRQARKPKAAAEMTTSTDVAASEEPVKKTRAKRSPKIAVAKSPKRPGRAAASSTAARNTSMNTAASNAELSDDGFADLMKLEEENQGLRKQLSEKLRAENAELRKRLGQN